MNTFIFLLLTGGAIKYPKIFLPNNILYRKIIKEKINVLKNI